MQTNASKESFLASQHRHVRQCTKEAWIAIACWLIGLICCTTVFVTMGYIPIEKRPAEPKLVWGIPAWVFWGLLFPWCLQIAVTWWFALRVLKDDEPYMDFPQSSDDE